MREFVNAATMGTGGSSLTGAATGQMAIALTGLVFMIGFGLWGAYLRWKDSKALREALEREDFKEAMKIRSGR